MLATTPTALLGARGSGAAADILRSRLVSFFGPFSLMCAAFRLVSAWRIRVRILWSYWSAETWGLLTPLATSLLLAFSLLGFGRRSSGCGGFILEPLFFVLAFAPFDFSR